jgi:acetyl esterase/lipase
MTRLMCAFAATLVLALLPSAPAAAAAPPGQIRPTPALWQTVTYTENAEAALAADVWGPGDFVLERTYVGVVILHGGGFTSKDRSSTTGLARWLTQAGLVAMNVDYRLAPDWVYPAPEEDVAAAVGWLRSQSYISRVAVLGVSAGAILADWAAAQGLVDQAVAWSGAGSFDPALIGARGASKGIEPHLGCSFEACPELWASAAPLASVTAGDPPVLQVHSVDDPVVGVEAARAMVDAYTAVGNRITYVENEADAHGGDLFKDPGVRSQTLTFLRTDPGAIG